MRLCITFNDEAKPHRINLLARDEVDKDRQRSIAVGLLKKKNVTWAARPFDFKCDWGNR